jgi:hypothetical protein
VFVHWPQCAEHEQGPVPLLGWDEKLLKNDLRDGQEVEILSWRPNSRRGPLYQVRRLADKSEWWIDAVYLRNRREAGAPVRPAPVVVP